ncbi:MAG: SLC13 family permease [Pseudomonadota bacterium]|nr:SLC13 family permease [Pseudomonadota bacterium]MEE3102074.1 SLC13 family permease [Pseudomonadota bacterium]
MTPDLAIVLFLLAAASVMFVLNRPRMDIVGFLMLLALPLTGVISAREALAGFSDPSVVMIAALFVIGEGLARTGVAARLGDLLAARAGRSEGRLIALLMVAAALMGAVMSSTAVVAILIPVALRMARAGGVPARRLLMPLSAGALISGMMALVGTPANLVVHGELIRRGLDGFGFFDVTPIGVPVLLGAVAWMLAARRLLDRPQAEDPPDADAGADARPAPRLAGWAEAYGLDGRLRMLEVPPGAAAAGHPLSELGLHGADGLTLLAVERAEGFGRRVIPPRPETRLSAGDLVLVAGAGPEGGAAIERRAAALGLVSAPPPPDWLARMSREVGMAEILVAPDSALIGKSPVESRFRTRFGLSVIGLRHGRDPAAPAAPHEPLRAGDTLLVAGPWPAIGRLGGAAGPGGRRAGELIPLALPEELGDVAPQAARAPWALAGLAVMVALMVTGWTGNVEAALIGCLILGVSGCIDADGAYRALRWRSLMLIAGMLPFALALERTGGASLAADALLAAVSGAGPRATLALLFALTMGLSLVMSNTAAAILLAPVALELAAGLGASPAPFAMTVAVAASTAFMTPVASPVNMLVVGPGDYRFADFLKMGAPLSLIAMAATVGLVPALMPF